MNLNFPNIFCVICSPILPRKKTIFKLVYKISGNKFNNLTFFFFTDFRVVSKRQLTCASCGNEVSSISGNVFSHPILGVLQCKVSTLIILILDF